MNINMLKPDYSFLFSSLSSNSGSRSSGIGNLNFLADYASIKNGSYGKLLKAYYQKVVGNDNSSSSSEKSEKTNISKLTTSTAADSAKTLATIDKAADNLKASADALTAKGDDSVFAAKKVEKRLEDGTVSTVTEYDTEAIYGAVSSFVNNYNSLIDAVGNSDSFSVQNAASNMTNITSLYANSLESVGITVGADNKLTIDADALKAADVSKLQDLFNDTPSFGNSISSQASFVDFAASREATKANTYNQTGLYNNNYSMGNLFNSIF